MASASAAARSARALARRLSSSAPLPASGADGSGSELRRLADCFPREVVDDIYRSSFKRQTGVSLKCARTRLRRTVLPRCHVSALS
jgi:hypothetical protein